MIDQFNNFDDVNIENKYQIKKKLFIKIINYKKISYVY